MYLEDSLDVELVTTLNVVDLTLLFSLPLWNRYWKAHSDNMSFSFARSIKPRSQSCWSTLALGL
ncbi:hypothetical protein CQ011_07835 [Arthrobacter sp. MYb213]|nr:hypothetical protein CQ011_07835 [Arthrobacter sp. MYb213]